jgi:hypothetical protein
MILDSRCLVSQGSRYTAKAFVRFSRNQIIGALLLLFLIWAIILFRVLSSDA